MAGTNSNLPPGYRGGASRQTGEGGGHVAGDAVLRSWDGRVHWRTGCVRRAQTRQGLKLMSQVRLGPATGTRASPRSFARFGQAFVTFTMVARLGSRRPLHRVFARTAPARRPPRPPDRKRPSPRTCNRDCCGYTVRRPADPVGYDAASRTRITGGAVTPRTSRSRR